MPVFDNCIDFLLIDKPGKWDGKTWFGKECRDCLTLIDNEEEMVSNLLLLRSSLKQNKS